MQKNALLFIVILLASVYACGPKVNVLDQELQEKISLPYMTWYLRQAKKEDGLKVQRMFQSVL
jgi:hypothetical protein